jgi:nitrous oxidase accessory protein NosD
MKPGSIGEWLRPTLGAVLLLAGAVGLAYKVISGYRHATPEAFISVQDQDKLHAASAVDHPVEAATASSNVVSSGSDATTATVTAPSPVVPGPASESASSNAADVNRGAEVQDNPACAAIETERHEIEAGLKKQYSPEEGRYMQRRLRQLAAQSVKRKCRGGL